MSVLIISDGQICLSMRALTGDKIRERHMLWLFNQVTCTGRYDRDDKVTTVGRSRRFLLCCYSEDASEKTI